MRLQKKDVWKLNKEEKRKVKRCTIHSKNAVNEQLQDAVITGRKLFWKEVSNVN